MKECSKCRQLKDESRFSPDKRNASGLQSQCNDCKREYQQANKERIAERTKAHRQANAELLSERAKAKYHADIERNRAISRENARRRREAGKVDKERKRQVDADARRKNPEQYREAQRKWNQANPEIVKAAKARYRDRHRETLRVKGREYNAANKHILKAAKARRRIRESRAGGTFTANEWRSLCIAYGYRCLCCGKMEPDIQLTPDHVIPLARGGSNDIANIQPLCLTCNLQKGIKTTDYRTLQVEQHSLW